MQVIAQNLKDSEIEALASYYARLPPQTAWSNIPPAPPAGIMLAQEGDAIRAIPACNSCHGSETSRAAGQIPSLYGQHPIYLANQLQAWQSGARKNDPGSVMAEIAKKLTPIEIGAVAIYYSRFPRSAR
jgi:cytochrome c553